MPRTCRTAASSAAGLVMLAAVGGCAVNPVTGERELALVSEEQEIAMGAEGAQQVEQSIGLVDDPALQQYVDRVGQSLAADSERPQLPWRFGVIDDPTPNAFALPGGYIYITRGLMSLLTSEAEMAAVLGHEVAHVTARHSVQQISRAQLAQLGLGLGMILSPEVAQLGDLVGGGIELLFLSYGRDAERQADELGFGYALDEAYDPAEMADVFRALLRSSEMAGASPLPGWLASHPAEPERIENVEARLEALETLPDDLIVGRREYLNALDGTVYGNDPRNGFFDGDWFYHPELVFRLRIPEQWQRRNLPAAVQGVSPEQDAAARLTLAEGSPAEAASAFFAQQGIAEVASSRVEVSGFPAVLSRFRAEAQGGGVDGYVAHIGYGGATYRVVGYAPTAGFSRHATLLEQIVTSFAPVTDEEVLGAQPLRIEVVELPRAMTLAEFADEYRSSVPSEELALINQIDDAEAAIPAGTALKVVVG